MAMDLAEGLGQICPLTVRLVHKNQQRDVLLKQRLEKHLRLRLNAVHSIHQ